jgi:4-diphosphocytidyl-2-C-methyl-D-erythritol kinase
MAGDIAASRPLVEQAWAKVNLTLQVTGRRADGYHELDSLVVFAGVGDELRFQPAGGNDLTLAIEGPQAGPLLNEQDNLVLRAARALGRGSGVVAGAKIVLTKNLPVASGIGGGSADAAAALRGLCRLWNVRPPAAELEALALTLGADVPVCLRGDPVVMSGIGEKLLPVAALPPLWLLLVNPGVAVSTAAVFKARSGNFSRGADPTPPPLGLPALIRWLEARPNDLEAPALALAPEIGEVLQALRGLPQCLFARMSGSGATCFGLFEDETVARQAAEALSRRFPDWWVAPAPLLA